MARKDSFEEPPHPHEWDEAGNCSCGAHDPLERAVPVTIMQDVPPPLDPLALLKELVDLHDLETQLGGKGANVPYDDLRRMNRERETLWRQARELIYGPPEADNKPKSAAEAKRWKQNEQRVSARRNAGQENSPCPTSPSSPTDSKTAQRSSSAGSERPR